MNTEKCCLDGADAAMRALLARAREEAEDEWRARLTRRLLAEAAQGADARRLADDLGLRGGE
ncbi:hypothetical protein [Marinitenerispora sediminis]|uniref:Uncharacterized protein n=1 Tax=Marinitenerispora sediminis TaxID=1931232 RepID=A0A368T229_9ACTN|nr:hypothetical protein [Marinitenerispora sediminis]RCV49211.1 hypothetical protein DEF28_21500 [Marinitenerispora sediminis]RCV51544.1 hypothetical protein DEF23_20260 [Marinitenerispora sediminis]RCV55125.1 hypothetical protein DEF24_18440 [Marinitenerispora sediminis]